MRLRARGPAPSTRAAAELDSELRLMRIMGRPGDARAPSTPPLVLPRPRVARRAIFLRRRMLGDG